MSPLKAGSASSDLQLSVKAWRRSQAASRQKFDGSQYYDLKEEKKSKTLAPVEDHRPLVITLHGIRTFAAWQIELTDELNKSGMLTKTHRYGYFSALKLIRPSRRKAEVERFREEYTHLIKEYPNQSPSIIAHSFGTYIVTKSLELYDGIRFDQVILCGSIVARDYDWKSLFESRQVNRVLNEGAKKDIFVKAAPYFILDSGASGAYGFHQRDERLCQRFIDRFGHSDYLHRLNYTTNWIPFLRGSLPPTDRPPKNRAFNWRFWLTQTTLLISLIGLVIAGVTLKESREPLSGPRAENTNAQSHGLASRNENKNFVENENAPAKSQKPARPERTQSIARHLNQARRYLEQDEFDKAISECNRVLEIDPKNSAAKQIMDDAVKAKRIFPKEKERWQQED